MPLLSLLNGGIPLAAGEETQQNVELVVLLLVITLAVTLISRPLRLPYTLVLVVAGLLLGLSPLLPDLHLDPNIIIFLFLPVLLFEGAWNVDIKHLSENWLPVFLLAVPGLLFSVLVVALLLHWGMGLPWLFVLLLGAIISPTDPVAVLTLLRQLGLSERLRTIVEGESLFNDGVGAVVFELVLGFLLISLTGMGTSPASSPWLFAWDVLWLMLGGLTLGIGIAVSVGRLLHFVDNYLIEMTVTLGVAYGVYLLGVLLHTSGLLAVIGAGFVLGSYGRQGMSERTQQVTHDIWEFFGYLANSFLFLLLGVQIGGSNLVPALAGISLAVVGVLFSRGVMVYTLFPLHNALARWTNQKSFYDKLHLYPLSPRWRPIFLLCGLRGALSIALVLSLPTTLPGREFLEDMVYGVVLVTLLGQGIGLRVLLPHWRKGEN